MIHNNNNNNNNNNKKKTNKPTKSRQKKFPLTILEWEIKKIN